MSEPAPQSLGGFIGRAILTAVIAAAIGTPAMLGWDIARSGRAVDDENIAVLIYLLMIGFMAACIIMIPIMLLVMVPITWPLRRLIARWPLLAAPVLTALGVLVGHAFDRISTGDAPLALGLGDECRLFGGLAGLLWAAMITWRLRRPAPPDTAAEIHP